MKVLLTGANGQLGKAISIEKPFGIDLIPFNRKELDITRILIKTNPFAF